MTTAWLVLAFLAAATGFTIAGALLVLVHYVERIRELLEELAGDDFDPTEPLTESREELH